jgi:hypothetical protein
LHPLLSSWDRLHRAACGGFLVCLLLAAAAGAQAPETPPAFTPAPPEAPGTSLPEPAIAPPLEPDPLAVLRAEVARLS